MWVLCPPAITRTLWLWETWRRTSTLRRAKRQQPMRNSTLARPAAASTPSLLLRLVGLLQQTHTLTHWTVTTSSSINTSTQKLSFSACFVGAEAGLMLSHWKLPQRLLNLGYHLRSHLTGGRSFPGGLTETGVNLELAHRTNPDDWLTRTQAGVSQLCFF